MNHRLAAIALLLIAPLAGAAGDMRIDARDLAALRALKPEETLLLKSLPVAKNIAGSVRLQRIEVLAPGAKTYAVEGNTLRELPRSDWLSFVSARSDAGSPRLAIAMSLDGREVQGMLLGDDGRSYTIDGTHRDGALVLTTSDADLADIAGKSTCALGDTTIPAAAMPANPPPRRVPTDTPDAPDGATHTAVVAIDTDGEFMTLRFADNTTTATNYLTALFTAMNVTYERDFNLRLLRGTTLLRTGGGAVDPYTSGVGGASSDHLDELGEWWVANQAATERAFVVLLSGKLSTMQTGGFSGIAWLIGNNNMCNQRDFNFPGCGDGTCTAGHYSVNRTWTNTTSMQSFEPIGIGHEIGHNFGASHTHCSDAVTGAGDTGVNTIDTCYSGEAGSGCYGGAQSCPAPGTVNGVPNVRGTIMSYCHLLGGCGSAGVFANGHRTLLTPIVTANIANSCFDPVGSPPVDLVFRNGFE